MIARLAPTSITTTKIRWLHEEGWSEEQMRFYLSCSCGPELGLTRLLGAGAMSRSKSSRRQHHPWLRVGRWVCLDKGEACLASAEAQVQPGLFNSLFILLALAPAGLGTEEGEAIALLISALLIVSRADTVRVASYGDGAAAELWTKYCEAWHVGEMKTVWTPLCAQHGVPSGLHCAQWCIDAQSWWQSDPGSTARRTLAYLEKRLHAGQNVATGKTAIPRLGLPARVSRMLRWR